MGEYLDEVIMQGCFKAGLSFDSIVKCDDQNATVKDVVSIIKKSSQADYVWALNSLDSAFNNGYAFTCNIKMYL